MICLIAIWFTIFYKSNLSLHSVRNEWIWVNPANKEANPAELRLNDKTCFNQFLMFLIRMSLKKY